MANSLHFQPRRHDPRPGVQEPPPPPQRAVAATAHRIRRDSACEEETRAEESRQPVLRLPCRRRWAAQLRRLDVHARRLEVHTLGFTPDATA